jgi:TM2 domain-containing membrane protein YozV
MNDYAFASLPGIEQEELLWLQELTRNYPPETRQRFLALYQGRRKEPQNILIFCLIGFFGIAGIHRFILDQTGMGILYLLTGGLCWIGTIVDVINHKRLTWEFNKKAALESAALLGL